MFKSKVDGWSEVVRSEANRCNERRLWFCYALRVGILRLLYGSKICSRTAKGKGPDLSATVTRPAIQLLVRTALDDLECSFRHFDKYFAARTYLRSWSATKARGSRDLFSLSVPAQHVSPALDAATVQRCSVVLWVWKAMTMLELA
jgi:hypothetical protein